MTAALWDVPADTARRDLLVLAHRQLGLPNSSVEDELVLASVLADRYERDDAFSALCQALRDGEITAAQAALDALTGVAEHGAGS